MNWLDTETYSEEPLSNGVYRYSEKAEVMIYTYAFDNGPVCTFDATSGRKMPGDLEYMLRDDDAPITAHNAMFDRVVLRAAGFDVPIERWRCTMVRALAHSLPGGLGVLCDILKIPVEHAKEKAGHKLIHLFCKPQPLSAKHRRATRATHPEQWRQFLDYAALDISAMRAVDAKLPRWNYRDDELALYHLDQQINDRGFLVDTAFAEGAVRAVDREQRRLAAEVSAQTGSVVTSATQRDALLRYILESYGVMLPDMQKSTLERRLTDENLPQGVRDLIAIRLQATTSSTAKYKALLRAVNRDGRLRGTLQFNGAMRTGRSAGRIFQPHNLPRIVLEAVAEWAGVDVREAEGHVEEYLAYGIAAILADCADIA